MIRPVTSDDAAAIAAIYNHYVRETIVTFEEEPVSSAEMASRIASGTGPWLVLEEQGVLIGYAYGKPFHVRSAYRFSFESTVYLAPAAIGRGHGKLLYGALLDALRSFSVHRVIGLIALPNEASVAFHERMGFTKAGHLAEVGYKHGRWLDVGYWSRELCAADNIRPDAP